jgi:uncharacterized iron-regulated membrane protein
VILEAGGIYLWWKQKRLSIQLNRGWMRSLTDLHHVAGAVGLPLMFLLAVNGIGMAFVTPDDSPQLRKIVWHSTRRESSRFRSG